MKRTVPPLVRLRLCTDAAVRAPLVARRGALLLNAAPPPINHPDTEFTGPSPARITYPPAWSAPKAAVAHPAGARSGARSSPAKSPAKTPLKGAAAMWTQKLVSQAALQTIDLKG